MIGSWRAALLVPTLVAVQAGCSLAFQEPTVKVAAVRMTSVDLRGGALLVRLDIENPNRYALESEDFRYRFDFLDHGSEEELWLTLAEGRVEEPVRISAGETGSVDISVPFEFVAVGRALGSLLRRGELEYRFSGELRARTPLGASRIPFDERGIFKP